MVVQGDKQMARTKNQTKTNATPGFAIEITDDTELGMAILMVTYAGNKTAPVGVVISVNEAREIAESHRANYRGGLEILGYDVWAQGVERGYLRLPHPVA
jgi:hypothetical protein